MKDKDIKKSLTKIKKELEKRIKDYPGFTMLSVYNRQYDLVKKILKYY